MQGERRPGMKGPASAISVQDGEIVVDAEFLAAGLGLSTELLKAEMRRGLVYSVAERGIDEDEGRTRLTFRYRARSWIVVVKPDGSLNDDGEPGQDRANRSQPD
jgi:hypothetical protein